MAEVSLFFFNIWVLVALLPFSLFSRNQICKSNIILGAFLVPWLFCNIFVGFPLVLLEVGFGQHTGLTGPAAIGKAAPVLKGVGFSLLSMNLITSIYSPAMIIAWAATFFFQSFLNLPSVPWSDYQESEWFWE